MVLMKLVVVMVVSSVFLPPFSNAISRSVASDCHVAENRSLFSIVASVTVQGPFSPKIPGNGAPPQKMMFTGPFVAALPVCKCAPIISCMLCVVCV